MTKINSVHPAIEILEKYKKLIWPEIDSYLKDTDYPEVFRIPQKYLKETSYQWKIIREYPERKGKYVRPTLLVLSGQAMGAPLNKLIKTAAAMQLSEEWILLHDDFEDDSVRRRGKPTLHRIYGAELAVNAGDMIHAIMWKVLSDNYEILDSKKQNLIFNEFYTILVRTILGQGVEIAWSKKNMEKFIDEDWNFIADGKTSCYTIALPMRIAAIIAGADKVQLEKITSFGLNLGRGFQLVDDILDITSNFSGMKIQGNDIYEGKKTVLLGHLLRRANESDRKKILKILEKERSQKTPKEVSWIIEKMHSYKSVDYAKNLAQSYKENSLLIFERDLKFLSRQPHRNNRKLLINFVIDREY